MARRPTKDSHVRTFRRQWKTLVKRHGTAAALHRACGGEKVVSYKTVVGWETADTLPSAGLLISVARRLGVTLDWLVLGRGPERPEMARSDASFLGELGVVVQQELAKQLPPADLPGGEDRYEWVVSGEAALALLLETMLPDARADFELWREYHATQRRMAAVHRVAGAIMDRAKARSRRGYRPLTASEEQELYDAGELLELAAPPVFKLRGRAALLATKATLARAGVAPESAHE